MFEATNLVDAASEFVNMLKESLRNHLANNDSQFAQGVEIDINKIEEVTSESALPLQVRLNTCFRMVNDYIKPDGNSILPESCAAWLRLSYAFVEAKFFADYGSLAQEIFVYKTLKKIDEAFYIPEGFWFDLQVPDKFGILKEFVNAKEFFENDFNLKVIAGNRQ